MAEAVILNGLEPLGQHVPEVTSHELHALDPRGLLNPPMLAIRPGEGDMSIGDRPDA